MFYKVIVLETKLLDKDRFFFYKKIFKINLNLLKYNDLTLLKPDNYNTNFMCLFNIYEQMKKSGLMLYLIIITFLNETSPTKTFVI